MNIRPNVLVYTAAITLFLMLFSGAAMAQEKQDSPVTPQEAAGVEPAPQQQAETIAPEDEKAKQPEGKQGSVAVPVPQAKDAQNQRPEESTQYLIKKGDTLWDIANAFFRDPFLWPFIWKANPYITNPDLIYPDNKLEIPNLTQIERAIQAPAEPIVEKKIEQPIAKPIVQEEEVSPREGISGATVFRPKPAPVEEEATAGNTLLLPEEQLTPIIDKYAMLSAGYVNSLEADGRILGPVEEDKTVFAFGDLVFVKFPASQTVNIGDKFLIHAPGDSVEHPKTGKQFGRLIKGLGILQITAKASSGILTAKITLSFDTIVKDNMLAPYQEPALVYEASQKKTKDIAGYLLEVTDHRMINGQLHFVYLDKGNVDNVEPGDRFTVYRESEDNALPKKKIGEVQVFIVKQNTSTAVVRKSMDTISVGDIVEYK